jgi:hypothetical protein
MAKFEFVEDSHQSFPEDQYAKEVAFFDLHVPVRVAYVRKVNPKGGMFWSPASVGFTKDGTKVYFPAASQDSKFVEADILNYLNNRKWEKGGYAQSQSVHTPQTQGYSQMPEYPQSMDEVANNEPVPF